MVPWNQPKQVWLGYVQWLSCNRPSSSFLPLSLSNCQGSCLSGGRLGKAGVQCTTDTYQGDLGKRYQQEHLFWSVSRALHVLKWSSDAWIKTPALFTLKVVLWFNRKHVWFWLLKTFVSTIASRRSSQPWRRRSLNSWSYGDKERWSERSVGSHGTWLWWSRII